MSSQLEFASRVHSFSGALIYLSAPLFALPHLPRLHLTRFLFFSSIAAGGPTYQAHGVRAGAGRDLGIRDDLFAYLFGADTQAMSEDERHKYRFVLNACPVPDMQVRARVCGG